MRNILFAKHSICETFLGTPLVRRISYSRDNHATDSSGCDPDGSGRVPVVSVECRGSVITPSAAPTFRMLLVSSEPSKGWGSIDPGQIAVRYGPGATEGRRGILPNQNWAQNRCRRTLADRTLSLKVKSSGRKRTGASDPKRCPKLPGPRAARRAQSVEYTIPENHARSIGSGRTVGLDPAAFAWLAERQFRRRPRYAGSRGVCEALPDQPRPTRAVRSVSDRGTLTCQRTARSSAGASCRKGVVRARRRRRFGAPSTAMVQSRARKPCGERCM